MKNYGKSGYAFAYMSNLKSIKKLENLSENKNLFSDFYTYFTQNIQNFRINSIIDPLDINWNYC